MQSELFHYCPNYLLWFCFVSCNQSANEITAACGNARPLSKGCCHSSQCWSPHLLHWSPSFLHHPHPACRSRDLHWQSCPWQGRCENHALLHPCWQRGSGPTSWCSQARRFNFEGWRHILCCCSLLCSPEPVSSHHPPCFGCCSSLRCSRCDCGASVSDSSRETKALSQLSHRGQRLQVHISGSCLLGTPDEWAWLHLPVGNLSQCW